MLVLKPRLDVLLELLWQTILQLDNPVILTPQIGDIDPRGFGFRDCCYWTSHSIYPAKPDQQQQMNLMIIIEDRHTRNSTILAGQLPVSGTSGKTFKGVFQIGLPLSQLPPE